MNYDPNDDSRLGSRSTYFQAVGLIKIRLACSVFSNTAARGIRAALEARKFGSNNHGRRILWDLITNNTGHTTYLIDIGLSYHLNTGIAEYV